MIDFPENLIRYWVSMDGVSLRSSTEDLSNQNYKELSHPEFLDLMIKKDEESQQIRLDFIQRGESERLLRTERKKLVLERLGITEDELDLFL